MFKRLIWFGSGVASGAAGGWYAQRKVRQKVERYTPQGMKKQAVERATQLRTDATSKVAERREAVQRVIDERRRGSAGDDGASGDATDRTERSSTLRAVPDR